MSIEAMKQALEALENVRSYDKQDLYRLDEDITALRTAIEQAEKRSGNVTFVTLAGKLMALGLVQSEAILDPDGYDGGVQWKAIEKLLRFVKGEDDEH